MVTPGCWASKPRTRAFHWGFELAIQAVQCMIFNVIAAGDRPLATAIPEGLTVDANRQVPTISRLASVINLGRTRRDILVLLSTVATISTPCLVARNCERHDNTGSDEP